MIRTLLFALAACAAAAPASAETLRLAVTTSFQNSGLAEMLLPEIARDTGLEVQLLVVGTGQAIRLGEAGDVDAILVHARAVEDAFVAAGHGTHRREIMYNDFILVGPADDPANAAEVAAYVNYLCPIAGAQEAMEQLDPELAESEWIFPNDEQLSRGTIFKPIDEQTDSKYQAEFQAVICN